MSDAKQADAEKLDKILSHLDSTAAKLDAFGKRMDAMETSYADGMKRLDSTCAKMDADEKARKDADEKEEEEKKKADAFRADAAKKDAEEEEKKKADAAKADAAKKDAEEDERKKADAAKKDAARADSNADLKAQIDALTRRLPAELPPDIRQRMTGFQFKAERVAQAFGDSVKAYGDSAHAPSPCLNESEVDYRVRLLSPFKKHSKAYKDSDLSKIQDAAAFASIEDAIYADAYAEASSPSKSTPGVLIPQRIRDAAGREITRYVGDPNACWDQFNPPLRHVRRILTPGANRVQ